jgi:signal transduction histidine kinase
LENARGGKPISPAEQGNVAIRTLRQGILQLRRDPTSISAEEVESIATAAGLLEAEFKATRSDLVRFQLVASAATLSLLYHHEVQFLSDTLDALSSELREAVASFKGPLKDRCSEVLNALTASKESLDALADLTQEMGVLDRKAEATNHDLAQNVKRAVARFKRVTDLYNIAVECNVDRGMLVGPMLKGELAAILLNVLSNAIKAVIAGGEKKPIIAIDGYRIGKMHCLDVKDNGIGLGDKEREAVFMPLVSDPSARLYDALEERLDQSERQLLGQGSGLGLSIVRGILERRGGNAAFTDAPEGWSTNLHSEIKAAL